jgi:hypothetical protein
MNKNVAMKWIKALRSGKYKQGQGKLQYADSYCCLGVLCKIAPKNVTKQYWQGTIKSGLAGTSLSSQPNVKKWAEIQSDDVVTFGPTFFDTLTSLNDRRFSFKQIADIIEKNWEKL